MYCLFECHLGAQVLHPISRAHCAAYYKHFTTYYFSLLICRIHIQKHTPCNNPVMLQLKNEILSEKDSETMFLMRAQ